MSLNPLLSLSALARSVSGVLSRFGRVQESSSPKRSTALGTAMNGDTARSIQYAYNTALLQNTVYARRPYGYREFVLKEVLSRECTADTVINGLFCPYPSIVGAYRNVLRGRFGQDITVAEKVDERQVNPALLASTDNAGSPLGRLWRMSNMDTRKQLLTEWAANLGTVGLRVTANADKGRVAINLDHPANLYGFDEDEEGNVVEVELRYTAQAGPIDARRDVKVREVLNKSRFFKEIDGETVTDEANALGVCPYVILRHSDGGEEFGRWAYFGIEDSVHWLNWVLTNQGESVIEHAWPQWFAAAGGKAPESFALGRKQVAYVQMDPDTPPPIFEPLVAELNHAGAVEYATLLLDRMYEQCPELILSAIKALSGQSGETLAKLMQPAVARIEQARDNYQDALIRAMQIGLSEGIRLSLWDLGTGTGSADAAERAFKGGKEDFAFNDRPALPPTAYDEAQQAQAETAKKTAKFAEANAAKDLLDPEEKLRTAGFSEQKIQEIQSRKATQGSIPTEPL